MLREFIPKFIDAKDSLAYRLTVLELIGRIHDTHANIYGVDSILAKFRGMYRAPVQIKFIEDRAIVADYYDKELGAKSGLMIGDIIVAVDKVSAEEIVRQRLLYHPASNYSTQLRDIGRNFLRGNYRSVSLKVERAGKVFNLSVPTFDLKDINTQKDRSFRSPDSCYQFIKYDIGYVHLGTIKKDLLPEIFSTFRNTKGIIIDIRNYPSEFVVFSMGAYLVHTKKEFAKFTTCDIGYPGRFRWTPPVSVGEDSAEHFKGKIVILVNELTLSQAEYTAMAFRAAGTAVVLGSTTAGADGNVSLVMLPGNIRTGISGIGVYYPDGKETQRVGIIPDVEVKPTIKGIREGRDELLEKGIEIIQSNN